MKRSRSSNGKVTEEPGRLRIIGGQWRGRTLLFPNIEGLRPTGDRIRETLFNWLMGYIPEARCLDIFSGSGALAIEALSRGASSVVAIELDKRAAQTIRHHAATLGISNQDHQGANAQSIKVFSDDALQFLANGNQQGATFDIVFIDPPFAAQLAEKCAELLEQGNWLKDGAWIYIEADRNLPAPKIPNNWSLHRQKSAGKVNYTLYQRDAQ